MSRLGERRTAELLVVLGALVAGGCTPPESEGRPPTVSLRMQGAPREATVVVDEETVGQLDFVTAHGIALPPGVHHVTVTASGYFPWDKEVDAKLGSPPIRLQVSMIPIPD